MAGLCVWGGFRGALVCFYVGGGEDLVCVVVRGGLFIYMYIYIYNVVVGLCVRVCVNVCVCLHVALVLLRVNIYPSWVHFWRFLPPAFAQPLAADLDALLLQTLQRLLGMALDAPAVLSLLRLPMAEGGLGMLQQTLEAQIHFLSGAFALQALCADGPVSAPVFSPDHVAAAVNSLQALVPTGLDAVLYTGSRRAAPRRLRQTVYSDLGAATRTASPWLTPLAYSLPPNSPIRPALQLRWALAWWPGHSSLFLPGPALRLAIQRHLGLNLFMPDSFCSYCPLRSGRVCGRPLGLSSTHVASCAQGPRLHRHHSLKGMWAQLLREAGFHVQDEQEVLLPEGGFRRADLVAIHHNGEQLALDVQCTGLPDFEGSALHHLLRQDDVKARRYGVAPQGRLPGGLTLHPLTHLSGIPFLGRAALLLLHRLSHMTACSTAPLEPTAWSAHLAAVRSRHAASLARSLSLADWRMHRACGTLL